MPNKKKRIELDEQEYQRLLLAARKYGKSVNSMIHDWVMHLPIISTDHLYRSVKTTDKISRFRFDWEDSLSDLKNEYTSVDLQHKSLEWR